MSNIYDLEKILYERNPEFKLIMTECEDAVVEREIIKEVGCKNILELGTAQGAWPAWIHNSINGLKFYLTENFEQSDRYKRAEKYPKDLNHLAANLKRFTNNSMDFKIYDTDYDDIKHEITDIIDYARIDCNTNNMRGIFKYLIQHGSDNLLIVLDDCTPNQAICRLLIIAEFIYSGELKVFWAGHERMAFCRRDFDSTQIINNLWNHNQIINKYFKNAYPWDDFEIAGIPQNYLVTVGK